MARVGKPVAATSPAREQARSARTLTHHLVLDPSADLDPGADPGVGPPQPGAGRSAPGILQNPRALRRSVLAEVALGVAVLVITTVLTGAEPGRAQAAAKVAAASAPAAAGPGALVTSVPFDVGTANGHGTVQITLEPGRVGENTVQAVVFGPDGGLATVPELRLTFALPARDLGPIDAKLADEGGYWGTANLNLPMTGTWTMRTTVRISDLDEVSVTKRVTITG
jgi:copper transport protein